MTTHEDRFAGSIAMRAKTQIAEHTPEGWALEEMQQEIDQLHAELERERHDAWIAMDGTNVKALIDALRFYAAPSSWVVHEHTPNREPWTYATDDAGELARKALDRRNP